MIDETFDGKSVIFVGNGYSLYNSKLGSKIDTFDEVFRFNEARLINQEEDVGKKFTQWVYYNPSKRVQKFVDIHKRRGWDINTIKESVKDITGIWHFCNRKSYLNIKKFDKHASLTPLDLLNICKRYQSNDSILEITKDNPQAHTGFITLYLLSKSYDKIYITGFDFFGQTNPDIKYCHYWDIADKSGENLYKDNKLNRVVNPKIDMEYQIINGLIKQGKIINLAHDTKIEKSKLIGEIEEIICSKCEHTNHYYDWEIKVCHNCRGRGNK